MSSKPHTDQVYREKRKPKGPIKFQLSHNDEQKKAKQVILDNAITVLKGKAGSGKTLVACQVALDLLFKKEIDKIIITRPVVSKEEIGFLPGDIREKMDPWLAPVYQNLFKLYKKELVEKQIAEGNIEILPFAFMRGITFTDSMVIVDEAQNVTNNQMEMVMGRLGRDSKMVICGDVSQVDLQNRRDSGFKYLPIVASRVPGVEIFELLQNHRHPVVEEILDVFAEHRD